MRRATVHGKSLWLDLQCLRHGREERRIEHGDLRCAKLTEHAIELASQNGNRLCCARLPRSGHAKESGSSDEYEVRAQAQCDSNVATSAHTAVDHERIVGADCVAHVRKRVDRCYGAVQLPATVIRHNQSVHAVLSREDSVFSVKNAFEDKLASPCVPESLNMPPCHRGRRIVLYKLGHLSWRRRLSCIFRPVRKDRILAGRDITQTPRRMPERFQIGGRFDFWWEVKAIANISLAIGRDRKVYGDDQMFDAGSGRPLNDVVAD